MKLALNLKHHLILDLQIYLLVFDDANEHCLNSKKQQYFDGHLSF